MSEEDPSDPAGRGVTGAPSGTPSIVGIGASAGGHEGHAYPEPERPLEAPDENALARLLAHLRARTGHDFAAYKRATVLRRIARRMELGRHATLDAYAEHARRDADEAQALFGDLLITVTAFFRDPEAWRALAERVLPALFDGRPDDRPLRVWVPGCATGEEAYTLAMLLIEEAERHGCRSALQVFASDLDEGALATARVGRYPASVTAGIDKARLERFFTHDGDHHRVVDALRDRVLFASHGLLGDPPFTRLDLISCRNLLIYLERDAQRQAFDLFRYALLPDGYLFLGNAESADTERFESLDKHHRLFRARADVGSASSPLLLAGGPYAYPTIVAPYPLPADGADVAAARAEFETLAPPSVLVDERFEIVRLLEGAGRYLEPADGAPTRALGETVRPELRAALDTALYRAFEHGEASLGDPVAVRLDGTLRHVSLWVRPRRDAPPRRRALVVFVEGEEHADGAEGDVVSAEGSGARERQVHEELRLSEGRRHEANRLHESTLEELRASNEELQSVNEEYRSTTEELETSKEELQSINEELATANAELKIKFEEISRAHDDLENLMAATDIGTLFVDRELAIQRFTPALAELFNVRSVDIGRPIADLTHRLDYATLEADARKVLATLAPIEREARHADDRGFVVRLRAYRTAEERIDGVVVTFVDITERREAERALAGSEARLHAVLSSLPAVVPFAADADGRVSYMSPSLREYAGIEPRTMLGATICERLVHPDDRAYSEAAWIEAREHGTPYETRCRIRVADGNYRWAMNRARAVEVENDASPTWFGAITDVDELTRVETTLREADRHRNRFLGLLGHELRNPLAAIGNGLQVLAALAEKECAAVRIDGRPLGRTVEVLERQSRHMKRLIDDLLDLTRVANGKIALRTRSILLGEHVAEALEDLRPRLREAGVELDLSLPDPALRLVADPDRFAQMLGNLLDNAVKFSDPGGRVELAVVREPDEVLISVRDDGIGIAPDVLPSLFRPFTQATRTGGSERGGLGLGLVLIRSLAELHGGTVEAYSEGLDKGSEFRLRLPLRERADTPGEAPGEPRQSTTVLSRRRILVVDDNPDIADPFAALLRVIDQEVRVAYDGDGALAEAASFEPQIAFLDLGMPGMDGLELGRRLRQRFPAGTLVLIALTGYGQAEDVAGTRAAGFDHHLLKPVRLRTVRELLLLLD